MSSRSSGRRCSPWLQSPTALLVLLLLLPLSALAILACAGAWTVPVFRLDTGGVSFKIGAQGYTAQGISSKLRFAYPAPASWPEAIKDVSLWLLFHFILAILLLVYLCGVLGSTLSPRYQYYRTEAILRPPWWTLGPAFVLNILLIALASRDAAFWASADGQGFKPDILGYFVVIGGLIIGVLWLWTLLSAMVLPKEYTGRRRNGTVAREYVTNSRPRGSHKPSKSKKGTSWWDQLTRN